MRQSSLKQRKTRRFASTTVGLSIKLLRELSGEYAARIADNLEKRDWKAIIAEEFSYDDSLPINEFRDGYLACEMLSKYPEWDIGVDRQAVALEKFDLAEFTCAETNVRLSQRNVETARMSEYTPWSVISQAKGKIARLLGPFSWDHAERHFGFGPGATWDLKARHGDAYYKYRAKPSTTKENAVLAYTCIKRVPRWFHYLVVLAGQTLETHEALPIIDRIASLVNIVPGNRVHTVPKSAKTDRIIAIEPTMNGYVQSGIGGLIRRRLKRVGVDLDDQTYNQVLAREGSLDGSLATIDLAAASDTVSMRLVEELLPDDWVLAIKQSRSSVGVLPSGKIVNYQKVSSMGNGYTFELESLIFWALSSSVKTLLSSNDDRLAVYGDDIIVPTGLADLLIETLQYCGFGCNAKKTFTKGFFRESCGKHYLRGVDVTPVYIRKDVDSPTRVIWFANQVRRWSRLDCWGLDGRVLPAYTKAVMSLPPKLRVPSIPDGLGDMSLFGDLDEVRPSRAPRGCEGWVAKGNVEVHETKAFGDEPFFLRKLSQTQADKGTFSERLFRHLVDVKRRKRDVALPESSDVPSPTCRVRWQRVSVVVARWPSYGPWLV